MKDKLYQLMNWAKIEGIVYSEEDKPYDILGPECVGNSVLYQTFIPNVKKVTLVLEDKEKKIPMDIADDDGFYAAMASGKKPGIYHYEIEDLEGNITSRKDPYAFSFALTQEDADKYSNGIHYELYKVLGSHIATIDGVKGLSFAVWVPKAMRISVVGEFNNWDGRVYPMNRVENTDIFTLFIPDLDETTGYQYEVKNKAGHVYLQNDPYAARVMEGAREVSKVHSSEVPFAWEDSKWMEERNADNYNLTVYEWDGICAIEGAKLKEQGFTHVALPQVALGDNFYEATTSFADAQENKTFVNDMHKAGLGVLFNWKASVAHDLGLKEVSNYYIANVIYWIEEYHMDGLIFSDLETLLYLDYGKEAGQWCPNMYGGSENLEGIEFVKHTNSILMKRNNGLLLFADLDAVWPKVTDALDRDGLGFHYRYDTDFTKDIIQYLMTDPFFRSGIHEKLTERMIYAYREQFVMAFSPKNVENLWDKIPGDDWAKFQTIKAIYAYISLLPGKVLSSFSVPEEYKDTFETFVKDVNEMSASRTALAREDRNSENFHWINCFQYNACTVSFLRKHEEIEETLMVVANFANAKKDEFIIGVPYEGKCKQIFTTADTVYGGNAELTDTLMYTEEKNWDGFNYAVTVALEPLSVNVYSFLPYTEEEIFEFARKKAEEIRLQLEEEARKKVALLRKRTLKEELAEKVEKAQEEISKGSEAPKKKETKRKGRKKA